METALSPSGSDLAKKKTRSRKSAVKTEAVLTQTTQSENGAPIPSAAPARKVRSRPVKQKQAVLQKKCVNMPVELETETAFKEKIAEEAQPAVGEGPSNKENVQETVDKTSQKAESTKGSANTATRQTEVTDFFKVRRSTRVPDAKLKKMSEENLLQEIRDRKETGLEVFDAEVKGKGVRTALPIEKSVFVCEYSGDLISRAEAAKREKKYAETPEVGCYMYYFSHKNKGYCVDATMTGGIGRYINHSKNGNLYTRCVVVDEVPRLIFRASRDIKAGEELEYDYGERNKQATEANPWLKN
eukprot:Colp12_sorted_trinity150504_noHs@23535